MNKQKRKERKPAVPSCVNIKHKQYIIVSESKDLDVEYSNNMQQDIYIEIGGH